MTNKSKRFKKGRNKGSRKNIINIDNTGLTKFIYKEENQSPKKTVFEWNGNYDGKNAKIHMNLDINGKKTKTDLKLSNQDLMNILGSTNVVEQPLDERLQSLDKDLSSMYPNTPINISNIPAPIFIHSGEMPMSMPMPMNEIPLDMFLENEIIANKSKSNYDTKKSKRKGKNKSKVKGKGRR
jgi:hypothetical protein